MSDPILPASLNDPRDRVLLRHCPMVMVPVHGALEDLAVGSRRLLSASDGIWLEARTPAFHFRGRVAAVPLPYGSVSGFCRMAGGLVPADLYSDIVQAAIKACPVEMACLVVWSRSERAYRLLWPDVATSSPGHVTYSSWADTDDLQLVVDAHSHGHGPAKFSCVDDDSDRTILEPHFSVVVGRCTTGQVEVSARFCCGSFLIDLPSLPFDC